MSAAVDEARLEACKRYMRLDTSEDDEIVCALMAAADTYLTGAGIDRATAPGMNDLIVWSMTLRAYDGRDDSVAHAATDPLVRQMLTQLKLRCTYGAGDADGSGV